MKKSLKQIVFALGVCLTWNFAIGGTQNEFISGNNGGAQEEGLTEQVFSVVSDLQYQVAKNSSRAGLEWKAGDENLYNLDMGFIKGSMKMTVRSIGAEGIWVDQIVDLSFLGKQNASMLYDPNTGAVKKFLVNGQEQQIPENHMKPVEVKEDRVQVPAGTFDCIYIKLKDEQDGKEAQAWINPQQVSVGGSLKMIQPGQMGNVTLTLKSYKKN